MFLSGFVSVIKYKVLENLRLKHAPPLLTFCRRLLSSTSIRGTSPEGVATGHNG
jgi:hypothetical protein